MCFSTAASFGAGVLLSGAAIVTARKMDKPTQWALAAIPGIFAIQQFSEGFVWLSLSNEPYASWAPNATFIFLFFAEVMWPAWIPLAMVLLEKDQWRRHDFRCLVSYCLHPGTQFHSLLRRSFPIYFCMVLFRGHHKRYDCICTFRKACNIKCRRVIRPDDLKSL